MTAYEDGCRTWKQSSFSQGSVESIGAPDRPAPSSMHPPSNAKSLGRRDAWPVFLAAKTCIGSPKKKQRERSLHAIQSYSKLCLSGSLLVFGQAAPRSCCSVLQPLSPRCSIRCRPYSPEPSSCASCQSMILQNAIQCKPGDTKCHCALNAVYTTWSVEFVVCTLSYFPFLVDMPRSNR